MKEFDNYKIVKQEFKVKYRGYSLNKLFAVFFISDTYKHILIPELKLKKVIYSYFNVEVYSNLKKILIHPGVILSHAQWKRKDYREIVNLMGDNMKNSLIFDYHFKMRINLRLDIIIISIFQTFIYLKEKYNFKQLLFLSAKLIEIKLKLLQVEKLVKNSKTKGFIAFNSSIYDDAIMCLVFNKFKIDTYSLQHGYYSIYNKNIPLDIINYENLTANKLLCWGKSTYNNMLSYGLDKNRLFILGNPKMNYSQEYKLTKPMFKKCLVLFGRDIYHESNLALLKTIININKITGEQFILKLHPTLYIKKLHKKYICKFEVLDNNIQVEEAIENLDFDIAISNNTSAYFDALRNGVICFRYTKFENEDFGESVFKFNELEDYYCLKETIMSKDIDYIKGLAIENLKYNLSGSFNKKILELNNYLTSK